MNSRIKETGDAPGANIEDFLKDLLKAVAISLLAVIGGMAWSVIEILRR